MLERFENVSTNFIHHHFIKIAKIIQKRRNVNFRQLLGDHSVRFWQLQQRFASQPAKGLAFSGSKLAGGAERHRERGAAEVLLRSCGETVRTTENP